MDAVPSYQEDPATFMLFHSRQMQTIIMSDPKSYNLCIAYTKGFGISSVAGVCRECHDLIQLNQSDECVTCKNCQLVLCIECNKMATKQQHAVTWCIFHCVECNLSMCSSCWYNKAEGFNCTLSACTHCIHEKITQSCTESI